MYKKWNQTAKHFAKILKKVIILNFFVINKLLYYYTTMISDSTVDVLPVSDTPLVFNDTIDTSNIKNILLIDASVSESQLFFDSANTDTFPIIYSHNSNRNDLSQLLDTKFSSLNLERFAFVFHDNIKDGKVFLNQELMFYVAFPCQCFHLQLIPIQQMLCASLQRTCLLR